MNVVCQEGVVVELSGGFLICGEDGQKTQYGFIHRLIQKIPEEDAERQDDLISLH
jgi:hypothetical protein